MEIVMMGQIYLKKLPKSMYESKKDDLNSIEIVKPNAYVEETNPEVDYGLIDGCLSFWQAYGGEDGIDLVERSIMPSNNLTIHFNNKEELEKEFMPLTEYLAKANFIGRKWRISGNDEATKHINSFTDRTVLYDGDNIMLVQNNHSQLGPMFEVMLRGNESINQSKYICEVNELAEEYKDKVTTYRKVFSYLSKSRTRGF